MAKLTVKNVGPIREAELEVKKHTIFIGPQGSGKSTLAKLIAISSDNDIVPLDQGHLKIVNQYNLHDYITKKSRFDFICEEYVVNLKGNQLNSYVLLAGHANYAKGREKVLRERNQMAILQSKIEKALSHIKDVSENNINHADFTDQMNESFNLFNKQAQELSSLIFSSISGINATYIPAERTLIAILSNSIWGLTNANIELPEIITLFASKFENARNTSQKLSIPFLGINYQYNKHGADRLYVGKKSLSLSHSASGYQSIIPLFLVVEHQRQQSQRRFIIEEPELNLYPTAQKDLIYSLMSGLQPDVEYQDAEWVITTHSPYVLSSFNTLMLAYKVAQRSEELRAEVEKIIPSRCWINPDEFAAYYVDNGTVRSIISEKTGLIADNELDDVSDDLADEQDKLFALSRSVPRD